MTEKNGVERSAATEVLRRMLDERGVEWGNIRNDGSESDYLTEWQFENNHGKAIAIEWAVGSGLSVEIHRYHLTPEQAIAATLGSCNCSSNCTNSERTETCRIRVQDNLAETEGMGDIWLECDACGWQMPLEPSTPRFNYCPNCGRRVVEPTTNDVGAEEDA